MSVELKNRNKKLWGQSLLAAIILFTGTLFLSITIMAVQDELWITFLVCWAGVLAFAAIPLLFLNYLQKADFPKKETISRSILWGGIGAILFGGMWVAGVSKYDDSALLACFGPAMGLFGFFMGSVMESRIPLFALVFFAPSIAAYFRPFIGAKGANILTLFVVLVAVGTLLYLRITRGIPAASQQQWEKLTWAHCAQCGHSWTVESFDSLLTEQCPNCN